MKWLDKFHQLVKANKVVEIVKTNQWGIYFLYDCLQKYELTMCSKQGGKNLSHRILKKNISNTQWFIAKVLLSSWRNVLKGKYNSVILMNPVIRITLFLLLSCNMKCVVPNLIETKKTWADNFWFSTLILLSWNEILG